MVTIKEVARRAGVSAATVSRYLSGKAAVSKDTAARISAAVEELDYLPNRLAQNLRTTRTGYILVLVPSIDNSFLSRVIRGIQQVGAKNGYSILLGITHNDKSSEREYLNLVKSRGVDGMILMSPSIGEETVREIYRDYPILQCSEYCTREVPYVTVDNRAAAEEITGLMLEKGVRKPSMISCSLDIVSFREREAGFRRALEHYGIPFSDSLVERVPLGFSTGEKAAGRLLREKADGIFAVADILAVGAIRKILDLGLEVPADIRVAGFDGIPLSRELRPELTTVVQPAYEMGKRAGRLIVEMIEGREVGNHNVLPYRIEERQST